MYHYVTDKVFLKESYSICADIVNQLVQNLKGYGIASSMSVVGSKRRGLVTQNENEAIDYDFNLWINEAQDINIVNEPRIIKNTVIEAFNDVLEWNGWHSCEDSTSAITTKQRVLKKGNKTPFSIDICVARVDRWEDWYRLIHRKTGIVSYDQYYWVKGPQTRDLKSKEDFLKPDYWLKVREIYLDKKNMYLSRQDMENHPSYNCYIEAVNEVYNRVRQRTNYWITI